MVLKTMRRAFTHMNDSRTSLEGTAGVAASAASLPRGSTSDPSICPEGAKKIEKVVQNGAFWCILMHATSDKMSKNLELRCILLHRITRGGVLPFVPFSWNSLTLRLFAEQICGM